MLKKYLDKLDGEQREAARAATREGKRKFDDKAASIDSQLEVAEAMVDWKRREDAEKSLCSWVKTYCVPLLLQDMPSEKGFEVLAKMELALAAHQNYMICMPRGNGKTSFVECASLFALATGLQKYVVVISNNARAANGIMVDIWRAIAETGTAFAQDYPAVCLPFQLCNGAYRRRQLYKGQSTELQKNAQNIAFARLREEDGSEPPTSGSVLTCRGVSSGLRGMKWGTMRPTLVLLDDLQTSETAESPEAVEKLLAIIRKDIMPLGGKERLSILQTATPICPDDMVQQLMADKAWTTSTYRAIEKWPQRMELWKAYFQMYDDESVAEQPHNRSLEFYKANRAKMDEGAEVFNPQRYSEKDGHISAIQKLLEVQHMIGDDAFQSEYQMKPKRISLALDLASSVVNSRQMDVHELAVPDGYIFTAAATDLNTAYAASTAVVAFQPDMTAHVVHYFTQKSRIDQKLPDGAYAQEVHKLLGKVKAHLISLGISIDAWAIDAGGKNWDAVTTFTKVCRELKSCAFAGKASHVFNENMRSKLRDALNHTILCGDAQEHVKPGAGRKYVFFDSDYWRMSVQKAFLAPLGSPCSCSLWKEDSHSDFAMQVTNEKLIAIKHCQNGKDLYIWKTKEPHDYLDCMAMCFAAAGSWGMSGAPVLKRRFLPKRPRIKIV